MASCHICGQSICICSQIPDSVKKHIQELNNKISKKGFTSSRRTMAIPVDEMTDIQKEFKTILSECRRNSYSLDEFKDQMEAKNVKFNLPLDRSSMSFTFKEEKMNCSSFGKGWKSIKKDFETKKPKDQKIYSNDCKKPSFDSVNQHSKRLDGFSQSSLNDQRPVNARGQSSVIREVLLKKIQNSEPVVIKDIALENNFNENSVGFAISNLITEGLAPLSQFENSESQNWLKTHLEIFQDWEDKRLRTLMDRAISLSKPNSLDYIQLRIYLVKDQKNHSNLDEIQF